MNIVSSRTGLLLAPLLCWPALAPAQVSDPTRPSDATASHAVAGEKSVVEMKGGLQATIVRPGGQSVALINGQYVKVGDTLGEQRVLAIADNQVVLKGETGREVIKLIPSIDKRTVKTAASAKALGDKKTTGKEVSQ